MSTLLLKVLLAPGLVVLTTLAGRRWGPGLAGVLVTLPVVAGPILLIAHLEHGPEFGARAAQASLLGLVALAVFTVVMAWASLRVPWFPALLAGWACCLVVGFALAGVEIGAVGGLCAVLAALVVGLLVMPRPHHLGTDDVVVRPAVLPWWGLPARAVATAVLVLAVTDAAGALGPARTGVLAPFPIAVSVVAAFALAHDGPAALVATLRGVLRGLGGFAVFCCAVALLLPRTTTALAFGAALALAVVVQAVAVAVDSARRHPTPTPR